MYAKAKQLCTLILVIAVVALCSSCLYSRLLSFKNQLAAFDKYVSLTGGGNTLEFKKPVLATGDITAFTGLKPTRIETKPDDLQVHTYKYTSVLPAGATGTCTSLCFAMNYTHDGMVAFSYPFVVTQVLGTNLIVAAAKAIGQSSFNQTKYKLDWSTQSTNLETTYIPSLAKITQVLGTAQIFSNTIDAAVAGYTLNLEGPDGILNTNDSLRATFMFDPHNSLLRKATIHVGKLELNVELPEMP